MKKLLLVLLIIASVSMIASAQQTKLPKDFPFCADISGATTPIVRYEIPFGTVSSGGVYCRLLVQNSTYLVNSAQIGNQSLIDKGIIQAVDVFAILGSGGTVTTFNNPIKICLQGSGDFYYIDASQSPRTVQQLTPIVDSGYTCGTVSTAGVAVLTNPSGNVAPVATFQPAGTPQPGTTPVATIAAGGFSGPVSGCTVVTTKIVRLREEPNTTSKILDRLAYNTTWTATERVPGWYRIIWKNTQGWVSATFLQTRGTCGTK